MADTEEERRPVGIPDGARENKKRPESSTRIDRSSVTLWRAGRLPRWSIRVVDGASHEELGDLVAIALEADRLLRTGTS
jgi:hypothetical protein